MAIVADSGGLYALYDAGDRHHARVAACWRGLGQAVLLPAPLLGELGYMLNEWLGQKALLQFLADVEAGVFSIEDPVPADWARCRELITRHADLNVGLCDAIVATMAERLRCNHILTVDERHFRVFRMSNGRGFTLVPADSTGKPS